MGGWIPIRTRQGVYFSTREERDEIRRTIRAHRLVKTAICSDKVIEVLTKEGVKKSPKLERELREQLSQSIQNKLV
jgi:hypothetical protein